MDDKIKNIIAEMGNLYDTLDKAVIIHCTTETELYALATFMDSFGAVVDALPATHPNGAQLLLKANQYGKTVYDGIKNKTIEVTVFNMEKH